MRKSIKVFIAMFIFVLGVLQISTVIFAKTNIPSATSDFYVNDFANVFSTDEKTRLMDNAVKLSDEHDGIQVVVTTVKSLDGDTIENYALKMYNQYEIGKDDMGLLILLSTRDRQIRVEVGKAMEAYVNDAKAGRLIDKYAIPSLKENKFNNGLINLQEALISEIVTNIESTQNIQSYTSDSNFYSLAFVTFLRYALVICILVGISVFIMILARKLIAKSKKKQQTIDTLTDQLEISKQNIIKIRSTATKDIDVLQRKIDNLSEEKDRLSFSYQSLKNKYETLEDRYQRVLLLYPTADNEVTAIIEEEIRQKDMALAKEVDVVIQKVLSLTASKDIVSKLTEAKACYSRLNQKQQSYVKSDINRFEQLYNESFRLKQEYERMMEEERKRKSAEVAVASIMAIISYISIGKARNLTELKRAKSIYDNLDSGSRSYFDKSVADKLDKLYKEAKRDKEEKEEAEREEEERRRHMQSSSNRSSFSSSSHHSGFGGRSGGGGASRGF